MTVHLTDFERQGESQRVLSQPVNARAGAYRNGLKRGLDIFLVVLFVPIILPLVGILALFVWRDGGNPFYKQWRVGLDGRAFLMWKLRSMVSDADGQLESYLAANPAAREEWNRTQKLAHDPRITRFGRFLRRTSLDELPQLWNVLKGDMSLVGPRPMMPCQQILYPGSAYFRLRPGVTGFWQISSRNRSSFADRAKFDSAYERRLSLQTDLRVLLGTVQVVLRCTGQ